jgi:hypothetical protein
MWGLRRHLLGQGLVFRRPTSKFRAPPVMSAVFYKRGMSREDFSVACHQSSSSTASLTSSIGLTRPPTPALLADVTMRRPRSVATRARAV